MSAATSPGTGLAYGLQRVSLLFIASALPTTARFSGTDIKLI